jgi:hypothetical protein
MGQITPNIGIYLPANGETLYGDSFAAGMMNVDLHDHSGPPNGGVPIASSGLEDGSVTAPKLNPNVVLAGGGLTTSMSTPNALSTTGLLLSLFNLSTQGVLCQTSVGVANARVITGTAGQVIVTNGDGIAGNPTISLVGAGTALVSTNIKMITTSQVYNPSSASVTYVIVDFWGAGGGGSGNFAASTGGSGGGGAGGYVRAVYPIASIMGKLVTIGAGGSGGASGVTGGDGGLSNISGLMSITAVDTGGEVGAGGVGGVGVLISGVGFAAIGQPGGNFSCLYPTGTSIFATGYGGSTAVGGGAQSIIYSAGAGSAGNAATGYGGGGSGGIGAGQPGGAGSSGICVITEFLT